MFLIFSKEFSVLCCQEKLQLFCSFSFYNTCLKLFSIFCLCSCGITISSTFLKFISDKDLGFTIFFSDFFSFNSPVGLGVLWKYFLQQLILFFKALSNNFFLSLLDRFLANNKNSYPLTHFHFNVSFLFTNKQCQINFVFYFYQSTILINKYHNNIIKLSVIGFQKH